jgi:hypothetical protein
MTGASRNISALRNSKKIPQFAPNLSVYVQAPNVVCLYSETRKFFLHGELYCAPATPRSREPPTATGLPRTGGSVYLRLSTRPVEQIKRAMTPELRQAGLWQRKSSRSQHQDADRRPEPDGTSPAELARLVTDETASGPG